MQKVKGVEIYTLWYKINQPSGHIQLLHVDQYELEYLQAQAVDILRYVVNLISVPLSLYSQVELILGS